MCKLFKDLRADFHIIASIIFLISPVSALAAGDDLVGGDECSKCQPTAQVALKKSAIPQVVKSFLRDHPEVLRPMLVGEWINLQKGPFGIQGSLEDFEFDTDHISMKQIPQEQLIQEDAAFQESKLRAGVRITEEKLTQAKDATIQAGKAVVHAGGAVVSGVCTLGKCIKSRIARMWNPDAAADEEDLEEDKAQVVPKKLKDQEEWKEKMEAIENHFQKRKIFIDRFKQVPQANRAEYEMRIPVKKLIARAKANVKVGPKTFSDAMDISIESQKPNDPPPEVVLRFSLGEDGKLVKFKLQSPDGRMISTISGGTARIRGAPDATGFTQLHAAYADRLSKEFFDGGPFMQGVANQIGFDTLRSMGQVLERYIENQFQATFSHMALNLGDVNELKAQNFFSASASQFRMAEVTRIQEEMEKELKALRDKADGNGPTGITSFLAQKLRRSRVHRINDLVEKYEKIMQYQVNSSRELPSKTSIAALKELNKRTEDIKNSIQSILDHPNLKDKKRDALLPSIKLLSELQTKGSNISKLLTLTLNKRSMEHDVRVAVSNLDAFNLDIRGYVDQSAKEVECAEKQIRWDDFAPKDDKSVMRVTLGIAEMNKIIEKYHDAGAFNLCNLISVEKIFHDCHSSDGLGKLHVEYEEAPKIGYDSDKKKFFISLGQAKTSGSGVSKLVPNITSTRVYFSFKTCTQENKPTVCIETDTKAEAAESWLDAIRGHILGAGVSGLKTILFGFKSIKVSHDQLPVSLPMFPSHLSSGPGGMVLDFGLVP